ncbi:MAG TPA: NUDIX hydrolase [Roseiflexaceae bacterium]|nr:NUDIX hydrolase [Roseiflexaceae bacterium]
MTLLEDAVEAEVAALAARYGAPRRVSAVLEGSPFSPLAKPDRYGEVCMVVRRPSGRLLTAIKRFYPPGAFRLLTGGIARGEPIEAALLRETQEETGLEVAVRRFLAVIAYRLVVPQAEASARRPASDPSIPAPPDFVTFAFLLDETGGTLGAHDEAEQIAAYREVALAELPALAATLEQAPDAYDEEIGGNWRDWGRFRAVVHRAVYDVLSED